MGIDFTVGVNALFVLRVGKRISFQPRDKYDVECILRKL